MHEDYVVFYYDGNVNDAAVIRIHYPPHEQPRGSILEDLLYAAFESKVGVLNITGAFQLGNAAWNVGKSHEIVTGRGQVRSVECFPEGWRIL